MVGNNNTASTSTDNTVTYDLGFPTEINSAPANGVSLSASLTQMTVIFNKDVLHDGLASAADNVVNYLLIKAGVNGVFDTVNCAGGLVADDTSIVINSAAYNAAAFTTTLNVNGGLPHLGRQLRHHRSRLERG